jgi:predicted component of type VI protein secretion system
MPRLYVLSGPDVGRTFSVRSGDTLGRSPDRILTLRHASVSRQHAHFEEQGGVWYVVDDGSQNGVLVGGERVARAALPDAAEFALGEILLRFRLDAPAPAPAPAPAAPAPPIEDEILLDGPPLVPNEPTRARPRPPLAPPPAPAPIPPAPLPPRASTQPAARGPSGAVPKVLQYHRVEDRGGFAASDLAQHPTWLRVLIVTCVLALGVAIAYFAFRGVIFVKGEVGGPP